MSQIRILTYPLVMIWTCVLLSSAHGQVNLAHLKTGTINKYYAETKRDNQFLLEMEFASSRIINSDEHRHLFNKRIIQVDLYYTYFREVEDFNQGELNRKRLNDLQKLIPHLFEQPGVTFKFYRQMGAKTPEEGRSYFHGFVITYSDQEFVTREYEVLMMDSLDLALKAIEHKPLSINCVDHPIYRRRFTGKYIPRSKRKAKKGVRYYSKGIFNRKPEYKTRLIRISTHCDTVWSIPEFKTTPFSRPTTRTYTPAQPDTVVERVLREKMPDWGNTVIACDVTSSMYPYLMQTKVWFKLNFKSTPCRRFIFFNDGDHKPDLLKITGKTKGIYTVTADSYEEMAEVCKKAMSAGGGGDSQENDVEALLKGQDKFRDAKSFILIADNYSPMRDYRLLKRLKKPVHVILCGTQFGVNLEYIQLARETGGTIHTMHDDLENLMKLNEGESFELEGRPYKIQGGKVVEL